MGIPVVVVVFFFFLALAGVDTKYLLDEMLLDPFNSVCVYILCMCV